MVRALLNAVCVRGDSTPGVAKTTCEAARGPQGPSYRLLNCAQVTPALAIEAARRVLLHCRWSFGKSIAQLTSTLEPVQVPIALSIEGKLPGSSNKRRGPACATVSGTMGKNQQHKSMQMAKHSSRGGGEAGEQDARYNGHDASFHTAEWHAARLAALSMERPR